jgi:serine protease inhibitor
MILGEENLSLAELPYAGGDLSMVILLPQSAGGLAVLETQLTARNLSEWLAALEKARETDTWVSLPRFKIAASLALKDLLKRRLPTAFSDRFADFSGMDGTTNLYLSDVVHRAEVEANEEGTKAVAATLMLAKSRSMTPSFAADHPFIFLIRDNASGSILFLGKLVDPSEEASKE